MRAAHRRNVVIGAKWMPACLADELRKTPVPEIKRRIAAGDIVSAAEWSGQNVCFGAHCRLKSDIARGPKSATLRHRQLLVLLVSPLDVLRENADRFAQMHTIFAEVVRR